MVFDADVISNAEGMHTPLGALHVHPSLMPHCIMISLQGGSGQLTKQGTMAKITPLHLVQASEGGHGCV